MLRPRKSKFAKFMKTSVAGKKPNLRQPLVGVYGLKVESSCVLSSSCIEAARRALVRALVRRGKVWICPFPNWGVSGKPLAMRMGKGKGTVKKWVAMCQAGTVVFEMCGVPFHLVEKACAKVDAKFPVKVKIVKHSSLPI